MVRKHFFEGKIVNNFTVEKFENNRYECVCECGNKRLISGYDLSIGRYKSCGCLIDFDNQSYENNFRKKFWSQVIKGENQCLNWVGVKRLNYGRINYKGKTIGCTRLIWQWNNGNIPGDLIICHKCDNPACVNIEHLFLGTKLDNMKDCVNKGRKKGLKGEKSPRSKLTDTKVREIKKMLHDKHSIISVAKKFSVGTTTIGHIKNERTWSHISLSFK